MRRYIELGKKLFPLCRSLTGNGTLNTLKILRRNLKSLKIKKIKSGTKVFDWQIPQEWNISKAYVLDKYNKKIIDFKNSNLHVVNYSAPIDLSLKRNDLLKKIYSLPRLPDAIPYVTSYYKKSWGFCETHINKIKIKKNYKFSDKFKVVVDSKFNPNGYLNYGELLIKGKSKKEILISTYICHPSMANNELSGPLVSVALARYYIKKKPNYSIRFLFVPETIGSIAYISKNLKKMKKNIIGGYVLSCIGDNRKYSYLSSKYDNSISDLVAYETLKKLNIKYQKYSFLKRGSDERQYNSPGIDLPIGSIMRSKYGTYPEYHTSLDNLKLINSKGLMGGYKVVLACIKNFQKKNIKNFKQKKRIKKKKFPYTPIKCEPFMSKRNLYHSSNHGQKNLFMKYLHCIQYSDGTNSLADIAKLLNYSLVQVKDMFKILKRSGLIKFK